MFEFVTTLGTRLYFVGANLGEAGVAGRWCDTRDPATARVSYAAGEDGDPVDASGNKVGGRLVRTENPAASII